MTVEEKHVQADAIAAEIRPMLAGRDPGVQGAVIAEMLATFVAGHHPDLRDHAFNSTVELARTLVPVMRAQLGLPEDDHWRLQ